MAQSGAEERGSPKMEAAPTLPKPSSPNRRSLEKEGGESLRRNRGLPRRSSSPKGIHAASFNLPPSMQGAAPTSGTNYTGNMQTSANSFPFDGNQLAYNMHSPVPHCEQGMIMQPMAPPAYQFGNHGYQHPAMHANHMMQPPIPHITPGIMQPPIITPSYYGPQGPGNGCSIPASGNMNLVGSVNNEANSEQQHTHEVPSEGDNEIVEIQPDQADARDDTDGVSRRGPGYKEEEDRVLCSAWLNISKDASVGTNQDKTAFYERMRQYYMQTYPNPQNRNAKSIQKRWSLICTKVSKFCGIFSRIERLNRSGSSYHDMVKEAVATYQQKEPWNFAHCWDMLKDEPKWNNKCIEMQQEVERKKNKDQPARTETPVSSAQELDSVSTRPEGRDAAKRRRSLTKQGDTASSSVAVDMLKKMNDRGQEMDAIDAKHKEEFLNLEKAKFDLAQKQLQAKWEILTEKNKLTKELKHEEFQLHKELKEAELKVQQEAIHVERMKTETQIMFTDPSTVSGGLRAWVLKRQMDIMIRDGVDPSGEGDGSASQDK